MKLKTQILHLKKALFQISKHLQNRKLHSLICFNTLKHNLRKIKLLGQMYTDTGKNATDLGAAKSRIKGKFIVLNIIFPWKSKENASQTPVPISEKAGGKWRPRRRHTHRPAAGSLRPRSHVTAFC